MKQDVPLSIYVFIMVAVIIIAASAEFGMGRLAFCKCGVVSLWSGDINSNQNSQQFADPYTFTHITHGVLLYGFTRLAAGALPLAARGVLALAIESGWEGFENTDFVINRYRASTISLDYYGDSVLNSIGQLRAALIGFWFAARFRVRASVIGIVLLEILLAFWIRDSLLLNIIMLIYPISVVRNWQMGG